MIKSMPDYEIIYKRSSLRDHLLYGSGMNNDDIVLGDDSRRQMSAIFDWDVERRRTKGTGRQALLTQLV